MRFNVNAKFNPTTWKARDVHGWKQPTGTSYFAPNNAQTRTSGR